jgi:4-amino-4-deoxy-L-arabinose transferase-like glycosyltransferase
MLDQPQHTPALRQHLYGGAGLALLIALYLLPGSIGHDPWRGDDVRHFAVVFDMLRGEGLMFPTLAGEPSTEFAPFYYWVSAIFALLFGWLLPLHDAARLATPFFAGLAIFWIGRTASRLYGKPTRTAAALLTLGTLGLVVHAHESQPMIALMAMQAMTLAGLAMVPNHPVKGSLQAAAGVALAFLSAGPAGLLLTLPLFLVIAIGSPECRNPRASGALILGLSVALGVSALWPIVLSYQAPELLDLWWEDAWAAFGDAPLRADQLPRLFELLGWFIWPLWPIALWALWRARRQLVRLPWLLPGTAILLATVWILANGSLAPATMLPLIAPFALLAAAGVMTLRRGAANAFDWFAVMTFAVFGVLIWLAWTAQAFSWPPGLARSVERLAPQFQFESTLTQPLLGGAICLIWVLLVWQLPRSPNRGPANWAMGMTMLWCLTVALLLQWFEHDRSYRPMSESLAVALAGEPPGCVAALGLSTSHRASLDYFAALRTEEVIENETPCRFLLVHDDRSTASLQPARQWQRIWEYRQGGGRRLEIFRLYRQD